MEGYSKNTDERMDDFSRKVDEMLEKFMMETNTVGNQIQGMKTSIVSMQEMNEKMKEEGEKSINSTKELRIWKENPGHGRKIWAPKWRKQKRTCRWESRENSDNRIPYWNNRVWSHTTLKGNDKWNWNGLRKSKNRMHRRTEHACFHSFLGQWRQKQVHQVSEHVEKRIERKKS